MLTLFIISTIFKGRVTSFLTSLPFQSDPLQFVSLVDVTRKNYRICFLNHNDPVVYDDESFNDYDNFEKFVRIGSECFITGDGGDDSKVIKINNDKKTPS
uniref:Putative secreted protein n=1 Tax=Ixodes ricinus TaxID=34613 RepID=A0A6B0U606_IXORI